MPDITLQAVVLYHLFTLLRHLTMMVPGGWTMHGLARGASCRIGWGSLAWLVLTIGSSATRSVFTEGGYSTLGFCIFFRGDVGYSLV